MKNLLKKYTGILSLLSFLLILPIHYAHAQNVDKLFGIKLFDNATNYFSSEFIENRKFKHKETISGFWGLNITSKASSPYFDNFYIVIDDFNVIHAMQGSRVYTNEDRCLSFLHERVTQIENKKNIKLFFVEQDYGNKKTSKYDTYVNDIMISIQCNFDFTKNESSMVHYISSAIFGDALTEYYNQD